MIIILYIAALIFALAFAVLVVYLSKTLKAAQHTLDNVASTLGGLEKQMEGISVETTALLNKTNHLADDIGDKSQKLNTLVDGVKGIGDSVQDFNESLHSISTNLKQSAQSNTDTAAQAMKWGQVGMDLYKKWQKEKPQSKQ